MKLKRIFRICIFLLVGLSTQYSIAEPADLVHFPEPVQTDQSMNVIIRSFGDLEISDGSELGCITPSGYVAGALNLNDIFDDQWGMVIWGDDALSEEIDGFLNGEQLRFLFWDAEHDWELNLSLELIDGEDIYYNNSIIVIDIAVSVPEDEIIQPVNFDIIDLFPNPFNNMLNIKYSLPTAGFAELNIYDITGLKQYSLFSGFQIMGVHQMNFSSWMLPSGNYFIVLKQYNSISERSVVLLK